MFKSRWHPLRDAVPIAIPLAPAGHDRIRVELVRAFALGGRRYRICSIPFDAYGISLDDVVEATAGPNAEPPPLLTTVVQRSGHSTLRLRLAKSHRGAAFQSAWAPLASLGCTYEARDARFIAVDVPPSAAMPAVQRALADGATSGLWKVEEGSPEYPIAS